MRPHGVRYARRVVPAGLRLSSGLGRKLVRSLGTSDWQLALHRSRDILAEFDAAIIAARGSTSCRHWTLQKVLDVLEDWRGGEMVACMGCANYAEFDLCAETSSLEIGFDPSRCDLDRALNEAHAYFGRHPTASREVALPAAVAVLVSRLEATVRDPARWVEVPSLDDALDEAFVETTMADAALERSTFDETTQMHDVPEYDSNDAARLPEWARERVREAFVSKYLQVVRMREWERSRHAAVLAAAAAISSAPGAISLAPASPAFVARADDKTFAEVVAAFLAARTTKVHRYRGIIAALEEVVGPDRPIRAITKGDVKAAFAFMRRIPKNAKKFSPELTLAQAVEKADADGRGE